MKKNKWGKKKYKMYSLEGKSVNVNNLDIIAKACVERETVIVEALCTIWERPAFYTGTLRRGFRKRPLLLSPVQPSRIFNS